MSKSLAIAYNMKRKHKKMADGGEVKKDNQDHQDQPIADPDKLASAQDSMRKAFKYAKGGEVSAEVEDHKDLNQKPVHPHDSLKDDLVNRIMEKMSPDYASEDRLYSEGGKVSNECEEYADEMPNEFDDLVLRDDLEEHYTGENSGDELGNEEEDERRADIVSRIMASRRKKDKNPTPA